MAEKRKDNRGRVLQKGESQRKDGTYMYRVTYQGERITIYAKTLNELREKAADITNDVRDEIDYAGGLTTVEELVDRCMSLKNNVKESTLRTYNNYVSYIKNSPLANRSIKDVTTSEIKRYLISLNKQGFAYSTIHGMYNLMKESFQVAVDDNILRKTPCNFHTKDVIRREYKERKAIDEVALEKIMDYMRTSSRFCKYYYDTVILLHTGMRVGELYGLTLKDINLKKRQITINKQVCRRAGGEYYVSTTKTAHSTRVLPIDEVTKDAFENVIRNRPRGKTEVIIDGVGGFLFLRENGKPRYQHHLAHALNNLVNEYNEKNEVQLPHVSPHCFRHTYCTRMAMSGVAPKTLQYLMGHSNIGTTYNIYTSVDLVSIQKSLEENPSLTFKQADKGHKTYEKIAIV